MDKATYKFETAKAAWGFMRACDAAGIPAGYPSLTRPTVQVLLATWMDRETADKLSGGAPVEGYEFGVAS